MAKNKYTTREALDYITEHGIRNLTIPELKELGRPLMSTVRNRLRRLEKAGLQDTPAYIGYVVEQGAKASIKSNNVNVLKKEIFNAYKFLEKAKTSSVKQARIYLDKMSEVLQTDIQSIDRETRKDIFSIIHRLEEDAPQLFEKYESQGTLSVIPTVIYMPGTIQDKVNKVKELLNDMKQEQGYVEEESLWSDEWSGNRW